MKSFIVELWSKVFGLLRWVSVFEPVRHLCPGLKKHWAVDIWALSNFGLALLAAAIAPFIPDGWVKVLPAVYGLLRVFEIVIYQMNVLLFDEHRAKVASKRYAVRDYRRLVVLLLQNYVEIVLWFAAIYTAWEADFAFKVPGTAGTFFGGMYSSFIVMTTFGDPNIMPKTTWGAVLVLFQSVTGLFMTLLSLARSISFLPVPESMDKSEH